MYINSKGFNEYKNEAHTPEPLMGTDTDRYDSNMTHIVRREPSEVSENRSKERRSRKDRSRETKLTNNRPLS